MGKVRFARPTYRRSQFARRHETWITALCLRKYKSLGNREKDEDGELGRQSHKGKDAVLRN